MLITPRSSPWSVSVLLWAPGTAHHTSREPDAHPGQGGKLCLSLRGEQPCTLHRWRLQTQLLALGWLLPTESRLPETHIWV